MRYTIYEDPLTHQFALLALPNLFADGDKLPISDVDRWFGSREEAIAALPDLLNREDRSAGSSDMPLVDGKRPHDAVLKHLSDGRHH